MSHKDHKHKPELDIYPSSGKCSFPQFSILLDTIQKSTDTKSAC